MRVFHSYLYIYIIPNVAIMKFFNCLVNINPPNNTQSNFNNIFNRKNYYFTSKKRTPEVFDLNLFIFLTDCNS